MTDGSTFKVKVEMDGVSFYPKTGLGRPNSREFIARYVVLFNQEQSFVTTPFVKAKLRSASYFVALVKAMLEYMPPEKSTEEPTAPVAPVLPPDIEGQLLAFLQRSNQGGRVERNADFIAYYYGFRGHPLPTLEDTAAGDGRTRELARKIIETKFRERVKRDDLLGVFRAQEMLLSAVPLNADEFIDALRRMNLIVADCSPAGLLRLIHDVTDDKSVGIFNQDLYPTNSAQTIQQAKALFFIPVAGVKALRAVLRDAKTLPGQLGIAKFRFLEEKLGPESANQLKVVRRIVESSSQFWAKRDGEDLWYLCDERENTLINNLFKAHRVTGSCPMEKLAAALHRALKARALDYPVALPDVIGDYLRQCRYLEVRDGIGHFRKESCEAVELSPPQEAVRRALVEFGERGASLPALKEKLNAFTGEFSDATVQKAIMNSPIVCVSGNRGDRTYRLLTFATKCA